MGAVALGAAAALAAVSAQLVSLVKEFGQAAEQTGNLADRLNLTWRETRNLEEMAQIAGVSVSGLQTASFRLAEALEGTSAQGEKTAAALLKIGVTGTTSGELLSGFLQKLAQIPDDTERIALAHQVLGRSSQQIIPLIKNYAELQEAIQHLGPAITSEMAEKLKASDDALDHLSISWNRFKEQIAVFAAPGVQKFVDLLTQFIAGGTMLTLDQQIGQIEAKMASLGEKSAIAGWLMADGLTKGKDATMEALRAQRDLLVGQEQAIERSQEYNAELGRSNAAAARATAARKAAAEAAAEAAREQYNAMVAFNNSVIVLYNSIPSTYSKYIETLSDGGKTAKSMLQSVQTEIEKASSLMEGMSGAPLAAMRTWVTDLTAVREKLKDFAADDAFNQLAVKFGELSNKFGPQMAEQVGIIKDRFDQLAQAAKNVPGVFDDKDELTLQRQLLELQKQLDDETQKFGQHAQESWEKYHEGIVKAQEKTVDITVSIGDRLPEAFRKSYEESIHLQESFKMLGITGVSAAGDMQGKWVAAFDDVVTHSKSLSEVEAAWGAIGSKVNQLAKTNLPEAVRIQDEYISALEKTGASVGQLYNEEAKLLQLRIQQHSQQGQSANSEIIALTNIRLQQQALITQTQIIGQTYSQMVNVVDAGFGQLGMNIGKVIVQGGDFWKTWHETLNNIEGQLLGTLISAILKMAEAWLINLIFGQAAYKAAGTAEIATSAAVGGAAAAASTAAIPIIGPALALEAGMAMWGSILGTFEPLALAGFSEGGMVPEDMIAMVHKGEYVLPAEKTAQAMLGGGPKGGGEIHVHFDFGGAHFSNGLNDNQVKTVFDRAFRMSKLAGALPAGRFPQ